MNLSPSGSIYYTNLAGGQGHLAGLAAGETTQDLEVLKDHEKSCHSHAASFHLPAINTQLEM